MKFLDPQLLETPDEIFAEIERVLAYMRVLAASLTEADFKSPGGLAQFTTQVDWLKTHYEHLEALLIEAQG